MTFLAINSFFQQVGQSTELRTSVEAALEDRPLAAAFEIVDIAKAHGCDFTATELREYLASESSDAELSESQLEAVAGGLLFVRTLDLTGLRKLRKLPLDQIRARRVKRI